MARKIKHRRRKRQQHFAWERCPVSLAHTHTHTYETAAPLLGWILWGIFGEDVTPTIVALSCQTVRQLVALSLSRLDALLFDSFYDVASFMSAPVCVSVSESVCERYSVANGLHLLFLLRHPSSLSLAPTKTHTHEHQRSCARCLTQRPPPPLHHDSRHHPASLPPTLHSFNFFCWFSCSPFSCYLPASRLQFARHGCGCFNRYNGTYLLLILFYILYNIILFNII